MSTTGLPTYERVIGGKTVEVSANSPQEAEEKFRRFQSEVGGATTPRIGIQDSTKPSSIGPTSPLDRDFEVPFTALTPGEGKRLSMRGVLNGLPSAAAMLATATPGGMVARIVAAGLLGSAGGDVRDTIKAGFGESSGRAVSGNVAPPSMRSKLEDVVPAMVGQGIGEGVSALAKAALPVTSTAGVSKAALDLKQPVTELSDSWAGRKYSEGKMRQAVSKGGEEIQALTDKLGPKTPLTEVGANMRDRVAEAGESVRSKIGGKFDKFEAQFKGQPVDASASLDRARDLPKEYPGVRPIRRELGKSEVLPEKSSILGPNGEEVSSVVKGARTVNVPFEDVRSLSKGYGKSRMRGALEADLSKHVEKTAPGQAAEYGALKDAYREDVINTFDRGVVSRVFKDPQQLEAVFKVPGSSPGRLAAVKKAVFSHPNPAEADAAWSQFKRAKIDQMFEGGPSGFAKKLDGWDPKSVDVVFGSDAQSVYRMRDIVKALDANPQQAEALQTLLQSGQPPKFSLKSKNAVENAVGKLVFRGGKGVALGAATGMGPVAGVATTEVASNLMGLAQNVVAHNPTGGLARLVNTLDAALKSGRTGPFWNFVGAATRASIKKNKSPQQEERQQ